jgi:hypothetical protein
VLGWVPKMVLWKKIEASNLCDNKFWTRVWTTQELILGQGLHFILGANLLSRNEVLTQVSQNYDYSCPYHVKEIQ